MSMERRILERIQEVELDIAPEFQKPCEDPDYLFKYADAEKLLDGFGWGLHSAWTAEDGLCMEAWTNPKHVGRLVELSWDCDNVYGDPYFYAMLLMGGKPTEWAFKNPKVSEFREMLQAMEG